MANLLEECAGLGKSAESEAQLMERLRRHKKQVSLLCGLADLGRWRSAQQVTAALSDFADAALGAVIDFILLGQHRAGRIELADESDPQRECGLIVLGMGKHGARELNYSSDIDVILFFDDHAGIKLNTDDPVTMLGRWAKQLVKIMQERTGDGYVFRTDLRLRPDPASTPPVIPVEAALRYYEGHGQNWERAALIKARVVAGDREAGARCLKDLAPFVWRKYLDYAAIQEVHNIKRQIHAHKGHGEIAVAGHNVKLGRGGIREIEFFAQTQQLIAGGRDESLREPVTTHALAELANHGWSSEQEAAELTEAYWYLRDLEHRLQMVSDAQIHTLPETDDELTRIAYMMGETSLVAFSKTLVKTLQCVEARYAELFESKPGTATGDRRLVFTGADEDPGTLDTLEAMGFTRPEAVFKLVQGWYVGRMPALRTSQARELLGELTPKLLEEFGQTGNPDEAVFAFDQFMSGLPAGIQLLAILKSNPALTKLLITILGTAPRLSEIIARRPHVFDGLLDPQLMDQEIDQAHMRELLRLELSRSASYEDALDRARRFFSEQKFLIGIKMLNGTASADATGAAFSTLAEVMILELLEHVQANFEQRHGKVRGGRICILAMGRLGSGELTATSDLDLIFLYDHDEDADESDGDKPLSPAQYFIRLTQRLIAAMSAPTAEGTIYELDFRLRPSGNAGPLATQLGSFFKYQRQEAWIWEGQALTRARPVAGAEALCEEVSASIRTLLEDTARFTNLRQEIFDMRMRIEKEKGTTDPWDIKNVAGGLIDIEFLGQWITLKHGPAAGQGTATRAMIAAAPEEDIPANVKETLLAALDTYGKIVQHMRICCGADVDIMAAPPGFAGTLCDLLELPDLKACEGHLQATQAEIRKQFIQIMSGAAEGKRAAAGNE